MPKCPHCGLYPYETTPTRLIAAIEQMKLRYSDETLALIWRVLTIDEDFPRYSKTLKFLARIKSYNDEEVRYGLGQFFTKEMHMKGYKWQYAAGFIERENEHRTAQTKLRQTPLPQEKG